MNYNIIIEKLLLDYYGKYFEKEFYQEWNALQEWEKRRSKKFLVKKKIYIHFFRLLEFFLTKRLTKTMWPPIFIIGTPRMGTTLIYHTFTYALNLSYICNLAGYFYISPGIITKILSQRKKIIPSNSFKNFYGSTKGWNSPCQARNFWRRWFTGEQCYFPPGNLLINQQKILQRTIALIERSMQMPFINKAQGNSVRIQAICEVFPNALFIKVNRDYLLTAQSILKGRRFWATDYPDWFSVKPKEINQLLKLKNIKEQVCEQIYYLEKSMEQEISKIGIKRVFNLDYETFCKSPEQIISDFCFFYRQHTNNKISKRNALPINFKMSDKITLSNEESMELFQYISDIKFLKK